MGRLRSDLRLAPVVVDSRDRPFSGVGKRDVKGPAELAVLRPQRLVDETARHPSGSAARTEKLRAADQVVALAGLRAPANDNTARLTHPQVGDQVGDSTSSAVESGLPSP